MSLFTSSIFYIKIQLLPEAVCSEGAVFGNNIGTFNHAGSNVPRFALDLTEGRLFLTPDVVRDYPPEGLLALEDVSCGLPMPRGAQIASKSVKVFVAGDIDVSADRLAFNCGDVRVETGDWIEGRLPRMGRPSADALPRAMGEGVR